MKLIKKQHIAVILAILLIFPLFPNNIDTYAEQVSEIDIVPVEGGLVKGTASDTEGVQIFKGIPYADDTSGENRFKAPQRVKPWEGVKLCDHWGNRFMQRESVYTPGTFDYAENCFPLVYGTEGIPEMSENALCLNLYTPAKTTSDNLPVLFYLHGGGFTGGNASHASFNASRIAKKGIIVVEIQYRLGAFGWLSLPELTEEGLVDFNGNPVLDDNGNPVKTSGNYAILDCIKGLQWVHDYIQGFGGNPEQITIAGGSAGAMICRALLKLNPVIRDGLFQGAILQNGLDGLLTEYSNGEMVLPYQTLQDAECENAARLQDMLGDSNATVTNLRSLTSNEFFEYKATPTDTTNGDLFTIYGINHNIVLDGYLFTKESVDLTRDGALDGIQLIIGGTTNEATAWGTILPFTLGVFYPITADTFANSLRDAFGAGGETITILGNTYTNTMVADSYQVTSDEQAFPAFQKAYSESILMKYIVSANHLNQLSNSSSGNVYVYSFDHQPPLGEGFTDFGAYHGCETWYSLNSLREGQKEWTDADYQLSEIMSSYIANFVKTGNPNGCGLPKWETCLVRNGSKFMYFSDGTGKMKNQTENIVADIGFKRAYIQKTTLQQD